MNVVSRVNLHSSNHNCNCTTQYPEQMSMTDPRKHAKSGHAVFPIH